MNLIAQSQMILAAGGSYGGPAGAWLWPAIPLMWVALLGLTVWVVARRRGTHASGLSRARELLAERYARGEVSGDEYRERLDNLR